MPTLTKKETINTVPEVSLPPVPPKKPKWPRFAVAAFAALVFVGLGILAGVLFQGNFFALWSESKPKEDTPTATHPETGKEGWVEVPDWVDVQLIDVDGASRRGEKLEAVRDLAVHYVANPGTSAQANRNYFAGSQSETSAHFIVGLEGEVIQCVPLDEKSSATNERNRDTISIEVCHPDSTGKFSDITYASLVRLLAWLCKEYDLNENNMIRHYDVTGKMCPLYYVEHQDAWQELKEDVANEMRKDAL